MDKKKPKGRCNALCLIIAGVFLCASFGLLFYEAYVKPPSQAQPENTLFNPNASVQDLSVNTGNVVCKDGICYIDPQQMLQGVPEY